MGQLEGKTILVTGGTGSFGNKFVPMTLREFNPEKVIVFSRDEMKQWYMSKAYANDPRVRFFIGDVRDDRRLKRALEGVDIVVHAAATKIVPTAEYNPFEAVKTNILGAMNLIDACLDVGVRKVVALSTDKASSPVNLYGATKMTSDKLFVAANNYSGAKDCQFSVVRYGNVMGSRGSVIPFFLDLPVGSKVPITDPRMTRFMITLEEGVRLVWQALMNSSRGEVLVKKIPSMSVLEIAEALRPDLETEIVGIRPGEKLHEQMISIDEANQTWDYGDHFRILPSTQSTPSAEMLALAKPVPEGFSYASNTNPDWMSAEQLQDWVSKNKAAIGNL